MRIGGAVLAESELPTAPVHQLPATSYQCTSYQCTSYQCIALRRSMLIANQSQQGNPSPIPPPSRNSMGGFARLNPATVSN